MRIVSKLVALAPRNRGNFGRLRAQRTEPLVGQCLKLRLGVTGGLGDLLAALGLACPPEVYACQSTQVIKIAAMTAWLGA